MGRSFKKKIGELGGKLVIPYGEGDDDGNLEEDFNKWRARKFCSFTSLLPPPSAFLTLLIFHFSFLSLFLTLSPFLFLYSEIWEPLEKEFSLKKGEEGVGGAEKKERKVRVVYKEKREKGEKYERFQGKKAVKKGGGGGGGGYDMKNPCFGVVKEVKNLCEEGKERQCKHVEVELEEGVEYETGDHVGVYPHNSTNEVEQVCKLLGYEKNKIFEMVLCSSEGGGEGGEKKRYVIEEASIGEALTSYFAITSPLRRHLLSQLVSFVGEEREREWLEKVCSGKGYEEMEMEKEGSGGYGCSVMDVLLKCPSLNLPFEEFVEIVPKLEARYYSISSSPLLHPSSLHLTVALVSFKTCSGRVHKGVASHWLGERVEGDKVCLFVRNSSFKLPKTCLESPLLMIGPGTGFAPFRGFLQHLSALSSSLNQMPHPHNLLFFGCRKEKEDFIYKDFMQKCKQEGLVSLFLAFSRDSQKKVYVQHLLDQPETASLVWKLLNDTEKPAFLYICGDANNMARDVHNTLLKIAQTFGNKSKEESEHFFSTLSSIGRYQKDIWS